MDQFTVTTNSEVLYPILFLPKKCTYLETNCEATDNVFIDLNITSPDTEGNNTCIYSGFCNIKLIDSYDVNIQYVNSKGNEDCASEPEDSVPVIIADQQPPYSQSQVWIDPARSPFVYNHYDMSKSQECYSVCHQSETSITVQQRNTYVTKSVYNYKEAIHYSSHDEVKQRRSRKQVFEQQNDNSNYEDDEFECGVFLSQLPEEIMNEKKNKAREECKFIGLQSENTALKQLMAPDIQSLSKQRKTILFLGPDAHCGQTIQQIAYYDPNVECSGVPRVDNEVVIDEMDTTPPRQKRYQCAKCHQIFDQISEFREHMVNHGGARYVPPTNSNCNSTEVAYMCTECGKNLKTKDKFEQHCLGHGDPDRECKKCHKVFASKFTLRVHRKIHTRKHACPYCTRTYSKLEYMRVHAAKVHYVYMCDKCDFVANVQSQLQAHAPVHNNLTSQPESVNRDSDFQPEPKRDDTFLPEALNINSTFQTKSMNTDSSFLPENKRDSTFQADPIRRDSSETEFAESYFDDVMTDSDVMLSPDPSWKVEEDEDEKDIISLNKYAEIQKADSVIAKVMSNKMFLSSKTKKQSRYRKICDVCDKSFDRVSDLKRHLIEHIVQSSLAKSPVSRAGSLQIQCEVCQAETFTKIDRYKAHLREHANLTLYKCTFCNKSFSDSSNFSKHKKIHGAPYFQCDLCQRKFNSKKMITRHMEYHNENEPLNCKYCDRVFHFESMLNKHIKSAHTKELTCRFRCRLCHGYFKSLKEKWDHEWNAHNVRKVIVDCLICGSKFRKYAELKRHCIDMHNVEIPTAKKLLKKKSRSKVDEEY